VVTKNIANFQIFRLHAEINYYYTRFRVRFDKMRLNHVRYSLQGDDYSRLSNSDSRGLWLYGGLENWITG